MGVSGITKIDDSGGGGKVIGCGVGVVVVVVVEVRGGKVCVDGGGKDYF